MSKIPEYRAYCDICELESSWYPVLSNAKAWRDLHFKDAHPDNPMKKTNCRIQRHKINPSERVDNPAVQARMEETLPENNE